MATVQSSIEKCSQFPRLELLFFIYQQKKLLRRSLIAECSSQEHGFHIYCWQKYQNYDLDHPCMNWCGITHKSPTIQNMVCSSKFAFFPPENGRSRISQFQSRSLFFMVTAEMKSQSFVMSSWGRPLCEWQRHWVETFRGDLAAQLGLV